MRSVLIVVLAAATSAGAWAQTPLISTVENAATNIPPFLPNSAIAQGGLFVVKGINLAPDALATTVYPRPLSLSGTSIQVTVAGTTVDAIMFYTLRTQVAAILPSSTPAGTGTLRLTINGQSATAPITVVSSNIGVFTRGATGTGDAVATYADSRENPFVSTTNAVVAGDIIALWATGLGPVSGDETLQPAGGDMPDIPLQVFIGGKPAEILYRGRNACCAAVDTVYVRIPEGLAGCSVSVIMQIGNLVSNTTSIPVATSGRACTPTTAGAITPQGNFSFGTISLVRAVSTTLPFAGQPASTSRMDYAVGYFGRVTAPTTEPAGSDIETTSSGSCQVTTIFRDRSTAPALTGTVQYLDAGTSLTMSAPFGTRTLSRQVFSGILGYALVLDSTATTLTAGQYTFTGRGGADVGAFTAAQSLPQPFVWTNQNSTTSVNRSNGLTVNWSGGDPAGYVEITGSSVFLGISTSDVGETSFSCTAPVSAGSFTVPPAVLLALPPSVTIPGTSILNPGTLSVASTGGVNSFQAGGVQYGKVSTTFTFDTTPTYQ